MKNFAHDAIIQSSKSRASNPTSSKPEKRYTEPMILKPSADIEKRQAAALARGVLERSPKLLALLERSQNSVLEGHGLDHDEFWARIETPTSDQSCGP
jgi:hypothetical protein